MSPRGVPVSRITSCAAVLALLAMLAVLSPVVDANAATGSYEVLVDDDGDPNTPLVREFAGASRYETALATARRYLDTAREAGTPANTAIIAAGKNPIDAAAAAGLARTANAPVLLTPSDRLFTPAAHLIESAGITRVLMIGGVAAVSEQVVTTLNGIAGVASVQRIGGANRFDTAALIAAASAEVASSDAASADASSAAVSAEQDDGKYCNSDGRAAVLVAGDLTTHTDITVAGPLSYAMGLPILLTSTTTVPAETKTALSNLGVTHAVIVGGPYSFANLDTLIDELRAAGVVKITRLEGTDRFDTSVKVLKALKRCTGTDFDSRTVALVSDTSLPDGISAAPILGQGLDRNDKATPVLLVGSQTFPRVVQDYLLNNEASMKIFAIGGLGAVSKEVAKAAVAAANGERYEAIPSFDTYVTTEHDSCRLAGLNDTEVFPHIYPVAFTAGFPLSELASSAKGTFRVAVLFVDFDDAPALHSTIVEAADELAEVEAHLEASSYGQLDVQFDRHDVWLRASDWVDFDALADEAVALAKPDFDFSVGYDNVIIIAPSTYFYGGIAVIAHKVALGDSELRGFTFVNRFARNEGLHDPVSWWHTAAHELGHILGLLDLYPSDSSLYELPDNDPSLGREWSQIQVGLMGLRGYFPADFNDPNFLTSYIFPSDRVAGYPITFFRPYEILSWTRWQLGWLNENQVVCLTEPAFDGAFTLSPLTSLNGMSAIFIPTSSSTGIVIESRRQVGYDQKIVTRICCDDDEEHDDEDREIILERNRLLYEGIMVYEVDASRLGGDLPLKFWPVANESNPLALDSFPVLRIGSSASGTLSDGSTLQVSNHSEDGLSYVVRVTRTPLPTP